jgi:L-fuculose-phosphate aldolase
MLEEFKRIGCFLFQEGLVDSHGGNLSLRQEDKIYITRRDTMLGDLKEGDIVEVGLEVSEADKLASRELPTHRAIYKATGAKAIVHAHPTSAIAVSITDNKIIPQDAEGLHVFRSAAIVRVHNPIGSEEVGRLLPTFLQGSNVVAVVKGHGSFAIGQDMEEAYKYTSCLEQSCKVLVAIRSSGGARPPAPTRERTQPERPRSAIPPGIGVMDRSRYRR